MDLQSDAKTAAERLLVFGYENFVSLENTKEGVIKTAHYNQYC